MTNSVSIIIPAKNEAGALVQLLPELHAAFPDTEIIVVDDGSIDDTVRIVRESGCTVLSHPYSMGNGAAIKTGTRSAAGEILIFMDGDGQHKAEDIQPMLDMLIQGYDMVVGERSHASQASLARSLANSFYNRFSSWVTGQKIGDLTSGFRVVRASRFREFLHLLPNGFSYPTTSTMAFFRAGYAVAYHPIIAHKRVGKSHINPVRDGLRFLMIIFKIGTLFSPLKIFIPFALLHFSIGCSYYLYTYITLQRFTNMSALLLTSAVIIFLMGLISEQITGLLYSRSNDKN